MTQEFVDKVNLLLNEGRHKEALERVQYALIQRPFDCDAWYLAGQCCRLLGDIDGAIKYLSRAAELGPDDPSRFLSLWACLPPTRAAERGGCGAT